MVFKSFPPFLTGNPTQIPAAVFVLFCKGVGKGEEKGAMSDVLERGKEEKSRSSLDFWRDFVYNSIL